MSYTDNGRTEVIVMQSELKTLAQWPVGPPMYTFTNAVDEDGHRFYSIL